jgi:hypothetical protein
MSTKSRLSAAAFVTLVAMSAMAPTNANAFSATSRFCEGPVWWQGCGDHFTLTETRRSRPHRDTRDTSPDYMKYLDSRDNQAMRDAGGGGDGGGGGGGGGR